MKYTLITFILLTLFCEVAMPNQIFNGAKKGEKKPGIIVVHEWWGHNDFVKKKGKELADAGYVALTIDLFNGKTTEHPKEAGEFAGQAMKDFEGSKKKFEAAIAELKNNPSVDPQKIAAIGFCFGGGVSLNMARLGEDLDLVASFHGNLTPKVEMQKGKFKGKVLVFNGAADPMVTDDNIKAFKTEMEKAGVSYEFKNYPGVKHAFTNPKATELGKKFELPLAYDEHAAKDSWQILLSELAKL